MTDPFVEIKDNWVGVVAVDPSDIAVDVLWLIAEVERLREKNDRQALLVDEALLRVTAMRQNRDHWRRRAAAHGDEDAQRAENSGTRPPLDSVALLLVDETVEAARRARDAAARAEP